MKNQAQDYTIDKTDVQILSLLMKDATIPYSEIAKKLIVSPGTVHVRMKKLKEAGIIKSSQLIIDEKKLGFGTISFMGIHLNRGSQYHQALIKLKKIPEVVELHYITGKYSMYAKLICKDSDHLRKVLNDNIQTIEGVERTETFISLEESIKRQIKIEQFLP